MTLVPAEKPATIAKQKPHIISLAGLKSSLARNCGYEAPAFEKSIGAPQAAAMTRDKQRRAAFELGFIGGGEVCVADPLTDLQHRPILGPVECQLTRGGVVCGQNAGRALTVRQVFDVRAKLRPAL